MFWIPSTTQSKDRRILLCELKMQDVSSLIAFYYVAQLGSITGAARVFNISQPAMSNRVKKFEKDIGVMLVERNGAAIKITREGHIIKDGVSNMMLQYANMLSSIRGLSQSIVICCCSDVFASALAVIIAKFRLRYPEISFRILGCTPAEAMKHLANGVASYFLLPSDSKGNIEHPSQTEGSRLTPRFSMKCRMGVMLPDGIPLAERKFITPEMISPYDAMIPSDKQLIARLRSWYGEQYAPQAVIRTDKISEAIAAARSGSGYAIVPMSSESSLFRGMCIRPLQPDLSMYAVIADSPNSIHNTSVIRFNEFLKSSG